jgi:ATP-dependent Clp protease ATP-binding subunit ClpB
VELQVDHLRKRLIGRHIKLDLTERAEEFIARESYDPVYGARPIRRFLQKELETQVARALITGDASDGCTIVVDAEDGTLSLRYDKAKETA